MNTDREQHRAAAQNCNSRSSASSRWHSAPALNQVVRSSVVCTDLELDAAGVSTLWQERVQQHAAATHTATTRAPRESEMQISALRVHSLGVGVQHEWVVGGSQRVCNSLRAAASDLQLDLTSSLLFSSVGSSGLKAGTKEALAWGMADGGNERRINLQRPTSEGHMHNEQHTPHSTTSSATAPRCRVTESARLAPGAGA